MCLQHGDINMNNNKTDTSVYAKVANPKIRGTMCDIIQCLDGHTNIDGLEILLETLKTFALNTMRNFEKNNDENERKIVAKQWGRIITEHVCDTLSLLHNEKVYEIFFEVEKRRKDENSIDELEKILSELFDDVAYDPFKDPDNKDSCGNAYVISENE